MPQGLSQVLRFERAKEAVICVLVELTSVGLGETSGGHLRGLPTTPTWVPSALKAHLRQNSPKTWGKCLSFSELSLPQSGDYLIWLLGSSRRLNQEHKRDVSSKAVPCVELPIL